MPKQMIDTVTHPLNQRIGITANALKLYATIAMFMEHISVFVPNDSILFFIMRFLGKSAAPIFFYFIVEGYHHTRDKNRYTLNLFIFAVISYVPFILCFDGALDAETALNFSVIYTLLIGLLVIRARHEIKNPVLKYGAIAVLFILSTAGDWSYIAPLCILTFDVFYGDVKKQTFAYGLIALLARSGILVTLLTPFRMFAYDRSLDFSPWFIIGTELGTLVPILLLNLYNGKKGKRTKAAKWGFYVFYPLHLLVIALLKMVFLNK